MLSHPQHTKLTQMILRQSVEGRLVFALAAVAAHGDLKNLKTAAAHPRSKQKMQSALHRRRHLCLSIGRRLCTAARECGDAERFADGGALPSAGCERASVRASSKGGCSRQGCPATRGHGLDRSRVAHADPFSQPRGATWKNCYCLNIWICTHSHTAGPYALSIQESRRAQ
jgi:hypothetical protein